MKSSLSTSHCSGKTTWVTFLMLASLLLNGKGTQAFTPCIDQKTETYSGYVFTHSCVWGGEGLFSFGRCVQQTTFLFKCLRGRTVAQAEFQDYWPCDKVYKFSDDEQYVVKCMQLPDGRDFQITPPAEVIGAHIANLYRCSWINDKGTCIDPVFVTNLYGDGGGGCDGALISRCLYPILYSSDGSVTS